MIRTTLAEMPPQCVYRLFARLAADRVNNRRTRVVMREWLTARPGLDLDAVKYRRGYGSSPGTPTSPCPRRWRTFCSHPRHGTGTGTGQTADEVGVGVLAAGGHPISSLGRTEEDQACGHTGDRHVQGGVGPFTVLEDQGGGLGGSGRAASKDVVDGAGGGGRLYLLPVAHKAAYEVGHTETILCVRLHAHKGFLVFSACSQPFSAPAIRPRMKYRPRTK